MTGLTLLPLYQVASAGFGPVGPLFLWWRRRRGKEDPARLGERLGRPSLSRPAGPLAWLHGASVGEALALLPLVERLAARGFNVLLSSGTATSAAVLAPRLPGGSFHQFLPLDVPKYMARFLDHWRPDIALVAESEIWPNLFIETHRRGVPILLVNARISARSFDRWRRLPGFIGSLLQCVDLCLVQSAADAQRLAKLGAPRVQVAGNLKYDVAPPPANPHALAELAGRVGARPVWLAASTHPGEEEIIFDVHRKLRERLPDVVTFVAPRQARRGGEIARRAAVLGLRSELHSEKRAGPLSGVYVVDAMGEMGLFYRLASVVFVGKSLRVGGGHNPIEAAKLGCAILHGPEVGAFGDVYAALDAARGAAGVGDADTLSRAVVFLLADAAKLRKMARNAAETVERLGGAADTIMRAVEPHIGQMLVERRTWE